MRYLMGACLLSLFMIPASLAGENAASRLFAGLAGDWHGTGTVNAMAANIRMAWEPVLDGRFQHLMLDNRMTGADGKESHFRAQAFYRIEDDGSITGNWFDSRGISLPLKGRIDGSDMMTIEWGGESTERGRSSYRITTEGLDVIDEVLTPEGTFEVFGRTKLKHLP